MYIFFCVNEILHSAERKLHNVRIRQINRTIQNLSHVKAGFLTELRDRLTLDLYNEVSQFIETVQLAQHVSTKQHHIEKFNKLHTSFDKQQLGLARQASSRNKSSLETDRWVKNISSRNLSQAEKQFLQKGLNFAVSTKNVPVTKIISATESAICRGSFELNTAGERRTHINASILSAKIPKSNFTKEEVCALNALRKDNSITILPADKGRCTIILDKKRILF